MTTRRSSQARAPLSRVHRADGFALPLTIFVVTCLTMMLATLMFRVQTDWGTSRSSSDGVDALALAQSGLQTYLGSAPVRPPDGDSVRLNLHGGYADVVAHVVRKPIDTLANWMYIVRSTGRLIKPTQGATPQAVRTVAQFADWQQGTIRTVAALTAINGLHYAPKAELVIAGSDACSADAIAGFRAPSGSAVPGGTTGTPATKVDGTWSQVAAEVGIDWYATMNGGFQPDYDAVKPGDTTFASYLLRDNVFLWNTTGTGLLIVTGELDTEGSYFAWDGIILVGGEFDPDADSTIVHGMVVSGLNKQLGGVVSKNDFNEVADDIYVYYDSCNIGRTMERFRGFMPVQNAWVDNWATY